MKRIALLLLLFPLGLFAQAPTQCNNGFATPETTYLQFAVPIYGTPGYNFCLNNDLVQIDSYLGGNTQFPNTLKANINGNAASASTLAGMPNSATVCTSTTGTPIPCGTFNVKSYGATGNGTSDDTTAIQNAINAAQSGSEVYFPAGFYKITSLLTLHSGVRLRGPMPMLVDCSPNLATCELPNGGAWIEPSGVGAIYVAGNSGSGVNNIGIENLGFAYWTGTAIQFGTATTVGCNSCYFNNVYFYGNAPQSSGAPPASNVSDKAIVLYNSQIVDSAHTTAINVNEGLAWLQAGSTGSIPGNSVWENFNVQTYGKSAAIGNNTEPGIEDQANLITFIRPQVNTYYTSSDETCDGIKLDGTQATSIHIIAADVEVDCLNGVDDQTGGNYIDIAQALPYSASLGTENYMNLGTNAAGDILSSVNGFSTLNVTSGNANSGICLGDWNMQGSSTCNGIGDFGGSMIVQGSVFQGPGSGAMYLGSAAEGQWVISSDTLFPNGDKSNNLGSGGNRIGSAYIFNGNINNLDVNGGTNALLRCSNGTVAWESSGCTVTPTGGTVTATTNVQVN